ncbi:unnamed protein product [Rangifer tarandus platyrhynchus]|uniref:Uncharacterized protein n=2 Tax=Rangifer tarandus platyrhynchus TaxID=3082113 RepID=A0ABN8ZCX6_RANTA|nr:unnamed protein product [Rangifer tarandus platyrhynchus]CAI9707971.1 unnamed protein product [Rangifer tarandus platyrhynchus]
MVAAGGRKPGEGGSGEAGLQRRQGHRLYRAGGLHNHTHRSEGRRPTPWGDSNKQPFSSSSESSGSHVDARLPPAAAGSGARPAGLEAAPPACSALGPRGAAQREFLGQEYTLEPLPPEARGAGEVAPGALSQGAARVAARVRPLAELRSPRAELTWWSGVARALEFRALAPVLSLAPDLGRSRLGPVLVCQSPGHVRLAGRVAGRFPEAGVVCVRR